MDRKEIYSRVDHTLLGQDATWSQIKEICDDAMAYGTASVCIPPSYVKRAKEYVGDRMAVCTVIGFPNGYNTTAVKVFETKDAIANGADEIDMVINIGDLKDKAYDRIKDEITQLKAACGGHILKVIIETCLLTDEERLRCVKLSPRPERISSRHPPGFPRQGQRSRISDSSPGISGKACA